MKTQREVISNVLNDFLGTDTSNDEIYGDNFLGFVLDEEEVDLLTNALTEALNKNESQN